MEALTGELMSLPVFNELTSAFNFCEVIPADLPPIGSIRRTGTERHPRSKNGFISSFPDGGALIGNWENDLKAVFSTTAGKKLTKRERELIQQKTKEAEQERRNEGRRRHESTAQKVRRFFNSDLGAYPTLSMEGHGMDRHPYLQRKAVEPTGMIFECTRENFEVFFGENYQRLPQDRLLVFPLFHDGELVSIQLIDEQGTKYFLKDGLLKGAYWQATRAEKDGQGAPIVAISEGVATFLSVMEYSRRAGVFVASMNAENLCSVAQSMKRQFPDREIFIYADSDKAHDGQRYGIGVLKAQKAQNAIEGLRILIPPFTQADTEIFRAITGSDKAPTDWNDYYRIWETKQ